MLSLHSVYRIGRRRSRRPENRYGCDPHYHVWEIGIALGFVSILVAWLIPAAIWIRRGIGNWPSDIVIATSLGIVGLLMPVLFFVGALVCIGIWLARVEAADQRDSRS